MGSELDNLRRYAPLIDDWEAFAAACQRSLPVVVWANPLRRNSLERLNETDGIFLPGGATGADGATEAEMLAARLSARGYECDPLGW